MTTQLLPWLACSLIAIGCDPVRTTVQPVRLRVLDSVSAKPVAGAKLFLKWEYDDTAQPNDKAFWEQFPWRTGQTDKNGETDIVIEYTGLDRTWGSTPPASRDETGKPYLIKVKAAKLPEEQVTIAVKAGASAKSKSYTVTIINIAPPQYQR